MFHLEGQIENRFRREAILATMLGV